MSENMFKNNKEVLKRDMIRVQLSTELQAAVYNLQSRIWSEYSCRPSPAVYLVSIFSSISLLSIFMCIYPYIYIYCLPP